MFNEDELNRIKLQFDAAQAQAKPQQPQKKKVGGIRGLLAGALPLVGGAVGATLGSVVAPIAGTAVGGSVGSGAGAFLKQKLLGEDTNIGEIGKEAALGAVPGVAKGAASLFKGARSAMGGVKAADATTDALKVTPTAQTTEQAMLQKSPAIRKTASNASKEGYGLTVGQSAGRGKVLTPGDVDETYNFITQGSKKYGGIRPGKPIDQARDAQNVFNNVTRSLDETLSKIDRPLRAEEPVNIAASIISKVKDNPAVTKATTTAEKFAAKIQKAKSIKELEAVRREADDLAYTASGARKTSAAAQAKAVREAIDEFVSPLSPEYKAIKGDYTLASDALEVTSKANKNAEGFRLPVIGQEVFKQGLPGLKNKINAKTAGTSDGTPPPGTPPTQGGGVPTGFRPYVKPAIQQGVSRALVSPFLAAPEQEQEEPQIDQQLPPLIDEASTAPTEQESAFSNEENVQKAYLQALAAGDKETASLILNGYEMFGKSKEKPLSAEAAKTVGTANSGLASLDMLTGLIESGGVPKGTTIPGRGLLGGVGQNILGTSSFDAAADNVADAMVRMRTGAAATKEELALYRRLLPQAFDPPEVQQQKIDSVRNYFNSISNRTGSAGTDMQAAVGL